MELFAVSDTVWNALIAAIVTIVIAWMNDRTKKAAVAAAKEAKEAVVEVKTDLAASNTKVEANNAKNEAKLEEIHSGVNGMNKMIEQAGFARGVKSETDKRNKEENV